MSQVQILAEHEANSPFIDLAAHLKAAGDPLRLEILRVLSQDSYGVLELCRIFDIKQSGMSHHLKVLANAGLLASRREGNSIFYRRASQPSQTPQAQLQQQLFQTLDQSPISNDTALQIRTLQNERAQTSQDFFTENADKFRQQQDLIASYPAYAEQVTELLAHTALKHRQTVLEIGPGEGEFLHVLAEQFERVIALDNSAEMLAKAKHRAEKEQLSNIDFILGDTHDACQQNIKVDCIVVNMVLHHTPSPAEIFQELSTLLKPGGALLITDLCRHDQEWVKESCGDLWMGFEAEDFSLWAEAANLHSGQDIFIALRNGFQIQIRQFFKNKEF